MKASKIAVELFQRLKAFNNNKDFVLGVMCNAPRDEDMKTILEFLDSGNNDVTVENIILLSLELGNER